MKNFLIALIAFILIATYTQAQDTLYIYKGSVVEAKRAIAQIDSITFSRAQDTLNILKSGNVVYKSALVNIDSLSFTQPLLARTYKDLDGNIYHTVTIGTQTWMLENLKTTKFRNGESIPNVTDGTVWANNISAAWCDYNNDPANGATYGHLYNWYAAADSRNIAPAGWHVSSTDEWATLKNYLIANGYNYNNNTTDNKIAKSLASTTYWYPSSIAGAPGNNQKTNNSTGFTALPGGGRYGVATGVFFSLGIGSFWWTNTEFTDIEAWYKALFYGYSFMADYGDYKKYGYSVRCIKSDLAVLSTSEVNSITTISAISGGNISFDGNDPVTARGVCWNTTDFPTLNDNKTTDGNGTGIYNSSLTALLPGTTYYVRGYATNSVGTAYGNTLSFKTLATIPTLTTSNLSAITSTTATAGGVISSDGGAGITTKGVCWSTNENPTIIDSKTTDGSGSGSFISLITGLTPGTTYYVRAYATNSVGTAYGIEISFTTNTIPTLTTSPISVITATTATGGGAVSTDGGAGITAKGVCWSTSQNPTISVTKTIDGSGSGSFISSITGLTPGTTYYVRAYATNSVGTAYGIEVNFTTNITTPTVTTSNVSAITATTATGGGAVSSDGGAGITAKGVCWSIDENPTINDSKTIDGTGTGSFISSITGLTPGTTYYVRAYATNSLGTGYGIEINFRTNATIPVLTTSNVSAITATTATGGGDVSSDGGAGVTTKGVCWSINQNPTVITDNKTTDGTGTGSFTSSITGLTPGTMYFLRAYATNSAGTAYGVEMSFTTNTIPTLTTSPISAISSTTATGGGTVSSDGGAGITAKGVCWSTIQNPTINNSKTTDGNGTGSFTSSITGLLPGTMYYVRGYATNSAGTAYGNEESFTTDAAIPTLTTSIVSAITSSTATCGGLISSDGGAGVTARGVCWNTTQNPTLANNKTIDGSGMGEFTSSITGLTPGTTYYVRAYATNSAGTAYGNEESFTTAAAIPTLTTSPISAITSTTVTSGGSVLTDGGASVTARGVCWSTTQTPTVDDSKTTDGSGTGSFSSSITGLTPGTTYYVRAYATNSVGTAYGVAVNFTTP